jgi:RNA polymerase sigma factor (sigma-70 family)
MQNLDRDDPPAAGPPDLDWPGLVRSYQPMLRAVCRRHLLTHAETEDVVQRTWLRLHENRDRIRDPRCLPGWLATTTRRECLAVRVERWRHGPAVEAVPDVADPSAGPAELVLDRQVRDRLHAAVRVLPPSERRVVEQLLDPAGPSYAEIADRLGMAVGSIGPIRGRALRHLRPLLADLADGAPHGALCG